MASEIGLFEALFTTRNIRKFKPDPVPDDLLRRVLEAACQAPNSRNSQMWRFVVIRSPEGKRRLSELAMQAEERMTAELGRPSHGNPEAHRALVDVPVLVVVCYIGAAGPGPHNPGVFGLTFPALQNMMLAARGLGLGGTFMTRYRWMEPELKEWLGMPKEVDSATVVSLGYPDGSQAGRHGKKSRLPLEAVVYEEAWAQPLTF